jgi:hypothetical protein
VGIVAWALGVPCCGYSTHGKTKRFYEQIGRQQFQTSVHDDPAVFSQWVRMFLEDRSAFGAEDSAARAVLRERALRNFEIVDALLKPLM